MREQEILAGVKGRARQTFDVVFDSVSVATTFKDELKRHGVIFCSISEAVREHPELVKKYMNSVVPYSDNKHACLNTAVFAGGSFVYILPGVGCPYGAFSLTYFRINELNTGQFERTPITVDLWAFHSETEGCTALMRDERQLHAAVERLKTHDDVEIKYSTVHHRYPGDIETGAGGIYNFVTLLRSVRRGGIRKSRGRRWRMGSAITWKYPFGILKGDNSSGEFNVRSDHQRAAAG